MLIAVAFLTLAIQAQADDAAAILARVDQYRNPIDSFTIDVDLIAYTPDKKSESSKFRVYGKGTDKSIVEFVAPATEKGKFLLMLRDAMWIYIPSASRPIRISPLQRLMGQASNGDVARTTFTVDYNAAGVAEEELEGKHAWVLDLAAKDPTVAYARVKLWVDQKNGQPLRADFYVVSGKLVKRAFYRDFTVMSGRRVVSGIEIDDLLRPGNRTVMRYANLAARDNPDKMFTKDSLGKW
jgi:outer membrane lipoprotein-sorting protein